MPLAHSKLTARGQISVPASMRKKLGLGPGSILEWDEEGGTIVVRRSGRYTFEDAHRALFPEAPPQRRKLKELKEGIAESMRERHGRR